MSSFRVTSGALVPALALAAGAGFVFGWHARDASLAVSAARAAVPPVEAIRPDTASLAAPGTYEAAVLRIVDGDTLEARVSTWPGQSVDVKVRLRGIDAPEMDGACRAETDRAEAARSALAQVASGPILLTDVGPDRYYGRVVARVLAGGLDVGAALLQAGHARPYGGRKREGWC